MPEEKKQSYLSEFKQDLPFVWKIHRFIFGKQLPDHYTRWTFRFNLLIVLLFLFWHGVSFYVIDLRDLIYEQKNINVEQLIFCRGEKLGFSSFYFLRKLIEYHLYSIFVWLVFLAGLILLWRKSTSVIYLFLGGFIAYFGIIFFVMNIKFFHEDTTLFDKVVLSIFAGNLLLYFYIQHIIRKRKTRSEQEETHIASV